jgi:hypothetical protein
MKNLLGWHAGSSLEDSGLLAGDSWTIAPGVGSIGDWPYVVMRLNCSKIVKTVQVLGSGIG